jgi:competence protein ComEC
VTAAHRVVAVRQWPDLRLVTVAAGTWLAAMAALRASPSAGYTVAALAVAAAVATAALPGRPSGPPTRPPRWRRPVTPRPGKPPPGPRRPLGLRWIVVALLVGVALGAVTTAIRVAQAHGEPVAGLTRTRESVTVTLTVATDPHPVGHSSGGPPTYGFDARLVALDTGTRRVTAPVRVFVLATGPGWPGLLPGQRIRAAGRLGPPSPGGLDAALLSAHGTPIRLGRPPWAQRVAGGLRAGLQHACAGLPAKVGGLVPGLIDGDTTRLDPGVADTFRATGMTHLLAVSGSNVAMVLGAVLLAARWCRVGPAATAVLGTLALAGFVILVRPSPSVLRAAAMGGLGLAALASGRSRAAVPGLAATVVALLVYDPALATDIGFTLSAFATAGLLLFAPSIRDALRSRRVPAALAEALAVPTAAQVACAPVIAAFSSTVSLVAVPANLLAVPVVPVATMTGVAAALVSPVWAGGAAFLAWLTSWPARWLIAVAARGAAAPDAVAAWPGGVAGGLLLAAVLAGTALALRHRRSRLVAAVVVVAAFVGAAPVRLVAGAWPPTGALLVACDVGQGDGLVLPVGGGAAIVVDAGPEPTTIDACLRRLGVRDVTLLVLTHFHADHVGGITGVYDGRRVDAIWTSPFDEPPEGYRAVLSAATAHHTAVATPAFGQVAMLGAARLTVLGPVVRVTGTRSDPNNNSLVIRVDEDGFRLLLTGDAEVDEQAEVLAAVGAGALRADVLKTPHHGSAYQDPAFLAAVAPAVAVVSVAAVNPYGLPASSTLGRLAAAGARVMRTDTDGDIAVLVIGGRLAVTHHH